MGESRAMSSERESMTGLRSVLFTVRYFWRIVRERRIRVFPGIVVGLTASLVALLIPWFSKFFIDNILVNDNREYVWPCLIFWFFLDVVRNFGFSLRALFSLQATESMTVSVGLLILSKVHACSQRIFQFYGPSEFLSRVSDVEMSGDTLMELLNEAFEIALYLVILPFAFMIIDPWLAVVVGITITLCVVSSLALTRFVDKLHSQKRSEEEKLMHKSLVSIDQTVVIQGHGLQPEVFDDVHAQSYLINNLNLKKGVVLQGHKLANRILFAAGSFFYRLISVYLVAEGKMTIGDFFAYNVVLSLLFSPVEMLTALVRPIREMIVSSRRVQELLLFPEQYDGRIALPAPGDLEMDSITMRYREGDPPALREFSGIFRRGEVCGLVGENGSGKSTLLKLIARHYDPDDGKILYNGTSIEDVDRSEYHKSVAYIPSEGFIFPVSFERNIVLNAPLDRDWLGQVIEDFDIAPLASKFPKAGAPLLWGSDVSLSSGEMQKVILAREVYHRHRIFLFDEAFSNIDSSSLQRVIDTIGRRLKDSVIIIASHDIGVIREADRIVCLKDGCLVEEGSFSQLAEGGACFRALFGRVL